MSDGYEEYENNTMAGLQQKHETLIRLLTSIQVGLEEGLAWNWTVENWEERAGELSRQITAALPPPHDPDAALNLSEIPF